MTQLNPIHIRYGVMNKLKRTVLGGIAFLAERVGFEPTVPDGTTVFKTVPL